MEYSCVRIPQNRGYAIVMTEKQAHLSRVDLVDENDVLKKKLLIARNYIKVLKKENRELKKYIRDDLVR